VSAPKLIDGKAVAARVLLQVREDVARLHEQAIQPALAVILVGNDPASQVYVRNKILRAEEVGIRSVEHRLPSDTSTEQLLILIAQLNADPAIHGILLQLPLPKQMDELRALEAIAPQKDVDGFHSQNVGGLSQGRAVLTPCTPSGCYTCWSKPVATCAVTQRWWSAARTSSASPWRRCCSRPIAR